MVIIVERTLSELLRAKLRRLPAADGGIKEVVTQFLHLFAAGTFSRELMNLVEYGGANLTAFVIGLWNYDDKQTGRSAPLVYATLNLHDGLFALHQFLVKARALSLKQQMTGERQSVELRRAPSGNFPAERKCRHRGQLVEEYVLVRRNFVRLVNINGRWRWLAGDRGEVFVDQRAGLRLIKIAGDRHHRVVWSVVDSEEFANVFDGGRVQVFHRANRRMGIRRILKTHLEQTQKAVNVWLIVITQPLFFFDGFALVVEIFLRDRQRAHAITFQPEGQRQLARRQRFEVVSALA